MLIGSKIIFKRNLTSTNSYVSDLLKLDTIPEGTIIYTNYQTGGRGQKGNTWESEDSKNLLISIILHPSTINPSDQFIISKAVSLGICDFLGDFISNVYIKWPNDIYAGDDKIAGMLIENTIINNKIENCIAGIGLNINQKIFSSGAPNPVSLSILTGEIYDLTFCLNKLAACIDVRYKQLLSKNPGKLNSDYLSRLYRFNEWFNYRDNDNIFTGRIISVSSTGLLQMERRDGTIHNYAFKEVEYIK